MNQEWMSMQTKEGKWRSVEVEKEREREMDKARERKTKTETMKKGGSVIMSDKPLSEFRPRLQKSGKKKKLVGPGWSWMPVFGQCSEQDLYLVEVRTARE